MRYDTASARRVAERFPQQVEKHEMTVRLDAGLHRNLLFRAPESSFYWFEIVTWPGTLVISGDMGAYAFRRLDDMFEFFRPAARWNRSKINPQYWAEKVQGDTPTRAYSEAVFRANIAEEVRDAAADFPGLKRAVFERVFNSGELGHPDSAYGTLNQFAHTENGRTFRFDYAWEWDSRDWIPHYLWCCHAIQWAISYYDQNRTPAIRSDSRQQLLDVLDGLRADAETSDNVAFTMRTLSGVTSLHGTGIDLDLSRISQPDVKQHASAQLAVLFGDAIVAKP